MSEDKGPKTVMINDEPTVLPDAGTKDSKDAQVSLPLQLQGTIGKQLKHVYGQILAEPMPDRFAQLLESLSKSEK
jgi:hypothetical protein